LQKLKQKSEAWEAMTKLKTTSLSFYHGHHFSHLGFVNLTSYIVTPIFRLKAPNEVLKP